MVLLAEATEASAAYVEPQVRDTALTLEDAHPLELALLYAEVLEQRPAVAEQHGDEVDLELVEESGPQGALCGAGAVNQHVAVAGCLLGVADGGVEVAHVVHERPVGGPGGGLVAVDDMALLLGSVFPSPRTGSTEIDRIQVPN
jgi:hypothetical protein